MTLTSCRIENINVAELKNNKAFSNDYRVVYSIAVNRKRWSPMSLCMHI